MRRPFINEYTRQHKFFSLYSAAAHFCGPVLATTLIPCESVHHRLALLEHIATLDFRAVTKHIVAPVVGLDEAETTSLIPTHGGAATLTALT